MKPWDSAYQGMKSFGYPIPEADKFQAWLARNPSDYNLAQLTFDLAQIDVHARTQITFPKEFL